MIVLNFFFQKFKTKNRLLKDSPIPVPNRRSMRTMSPGLDTGSIVDKASVENLVGSENVVPGSYVPINSDPRTPPPALSSSRRVYNNSIMGNGSSSLTPKPGKPRKRLSFQDEADDVKEPSG